MQSKSTNYALKVLDKWRNSVRDLLMTNVPNWYRYLARSQIKAAEQLMDAIRDDLEQQSTHRVLYCLRTLGLCPVINASEVNVIMKMCNGDDLAFLWFLWEMYYKTNPKTQMLDPHANVTDPDNTKPYSSNEQILLSSIFRLDLYTLLSELDRVLPLGQPAPMKKRKKPQKKQEFEQRRQGNLNKRTSSMPYFEPITMPRKCGARMSIDRPPTTAYYLRTVDDQKSPIDRNFTHWFSHYKLADNQNMVMSLLRKEIKEIFNNMIESGVDHNDVKSLCVHHKIVDTMEKSLANRLKLITLERAMRYRDVNTKSQEARRQRIVNELEQASEGFLERFREEAQRTRMQTTRKELFVRKGDNSQLRFCKPDFISVGGALSKTSGQRLTGGAEKSKNQKPKKNKKKSKKMTSKVKKLSIEPVPTDPVPSDPVPVPVVKQQNCTEIGAGDAATSAEEDNAVGIKHKIYDCGNGFKYVTNREELLCPPYSAEIGSRSFVKMCESDKNLPNSTHRKICQAGDGDVRAKCFQKQTPKSASLKFKDVLKETNEEPTEQCEINNSYFKISPNDAGLYHFDYGKIFDEKASANDKVWIKTEFIKAINTDIDLLNKLFEEDPERVIADAVQREALRIFRLDESYFKRTYERLYRRYNTSSDRLDFGQIVFDPDDDVMMNKMLRLALEHIGTNPNLVAPTLPNVWNVPFLNEWIQYRYGKTYSLSERARLYKTSRTKMISFTKMFKHWILPTPTIVHKIHKLVDYNTQTCLMTKSKLIRNEYNRLFSELAVEASRGFLFEMRPRHCSTHAVDTFFAYLPARRCDINFSVTKTRNV